MNNNIDEILNSFKNGEICLEEAKKRLESNTKKLERKLQYHQTALNKIQKSIRIISKEIDDENGYVYNYDVNLDNCMNRIKTVLKKYENL